MSAAFTEAVFQRLRGDTVLVGMLNTYLGVPAIFTSEPVPGDALLPYIVTTGQVTDVGWDTQDSRGRRIVRDIRCYAPATGSRLQVERMAEQVRGLFHRRDISVAGHDSALTICTGPIPGPEEDGAYGAIVTVESWLFQR